MFRPTGGPISTGPTFDRDRLEMDRADAPEQRNSSSAFSNRPELWGLPEHALNRVVRERDKWGGDQPSQIRHAAPAIPKRVPDALLPAFGGLAVHGTLQPELGFSTEAAAPYNRKLPSAVHDALLSSNARESTGGLALSFQLKFGLARGETAVSVPIARQSPRDDRLAPALRREPVSVIREHHRDDGSFAVAYETLKGSGDGERWVVVLDVDSNRNLKRASFIQSRGGTNPPGQLMGDFRFDKKWSKLETLPTELTALVAPYLSPGDLDSLARTSSSMAHGFAIEAKVSGMLTALAESTFTVDDLNRILTNCARNGRFRDLHPITGTSDSIASTRKIVEDPIAGTWLTQSEKGRLFAMLAQRVPDLDSLQSSPSYDDYEGEDDEATAGNFTALARLMLLDANQRLKPDHRADLSSLKSGAVFGSLTAAVKAGVPIGTAIATFGPGNEQELLEAAIGAAKVLIRTGSTWEEAALELGIPTGHSTCEELKWVHEATSFASMLALASTEELEKELDKRKMALEDGDDLRRDTMRGQWEKWHSRGGTQRLIKGERAVDVYADVYAEPDQQEHLYLEMHQAEIFQVTHLGPAMIQKGCTAEQVIEGLDIRHPVACHFARRFHAKAQADMERQA